MTALEIKETSTRSVSCNGDESSSHPLIYLDIAPNRDSVVCPYCSRTFALK